MSVWPAAPLGELCALVDYGYTASAKTEPVGPKFLRITDIQNGHVDWETVPYCDYPLNGSDARLHPGDIVFARTGATTGKSFLIKSCPEQAVFASYLIRVRAGRSVLPEYLSHFFNTPAYWAQIALNARGAAQAGVNATTLKSLEIPLPPLPEQRRIAAILDAADSLRAKRRAALAKLGQLAQSIFIEMFGDPVSNPMGWPVQPLGALITDGPQNGLYKPSSAYGRGTLILRIDAFYDGVITGMASLKRLQLDNEEQKLYGLNENDIVINRVNSREYLGKSAIVPALSEPIVFESNMMRFRVDDGQVTPGYLIAFLQTPFIKSQIRTRTKDAVNQSSINQQDVKAFIINVPPLQLQSRYNNTIERLKRLMDQQRDSLEQTEALFTSLQSRAFRGEL